MFVVNLVGLSLGPFLVGVMSDALKPSFGAASLRWALIAMSGFWWLGAALYANTARTLERDLSVQG